MSGTFSQRSDFSVAVEIHRETPVAGRHELRHADRARKRAFDRQRIQAIVARQQQELLQFATEVGGAFRHFESQRIQRVDHPERARTLAVDRFDADDGDNDLLRHAVDVPRALQLFRIFVPESNAGAGARRSYEDVLEFIPGLRRCRCVDRLDHPFVALQLRENLAQGRFAELVLLHHLRNELLNLRFELDLGRCLGQRRESSRR